MIGSDFLVAMERTASRRELNGHENYKPPPSKSIPSILYFSTLTYSQAHFPIDFHVMQMGEAKACK
jgi:hypothetical protein